MVGGSSLSRAADVYSERGRGAIVQYGFHFNGQRCTGCKTCMLACKDFHDLGYDVAFRQVYEYGGGTWEKDAEGALSQDCFTYYVSVACNHCAKPVCVKVCPTGAMHKDDRGIVTVDGQRCIGCGYFALSCPYRAPKVDREAGHSAKCDLCADRLDAGKSPICVEACPLRALDFGEVGDLRARYGTVADLAPLPSASVTSPHVVITLPRCLEDEPSRAGTGEVQNRREIV